MDNDEKRNMEKVNFFYEEGMKVHVERKDRQFWNGTIIGKKNDAVFLFNDDKFGKLYLFVCDIWEIEEYRNVI